MFFLLFLFVLLFVFSHVPIHVPVEQVTAFLLLTLCTLSEFYSVPSTGILQ